MILIHVVCGIWHWGGCATSLPMGIIFVCQLFGCCMSSHYSDFTQNFEPEAYIAKSVIYWILCVCVCVICDEFDFWRHKPQLDGSQIYCFFVGYPWKLFSCHIVSCQNVISKALNKRCGTDANNKPTFILTFWLRLDGIHKSLIANCFYHIVIKICAWLVVRLRDLSI